MKAEKKEETTRELLILDNEWVANGGEEPRQVYLAAEKKAKLEWIVNAVREKLQYERSALVYEDAESGKCLLEEARWEALQDEWAQGAGERRSERVKELVTDAGYRATKRGGDNSEPEALVKAARARIRGYGQMYELLEQRKNLEGIERAKEAAVLAVLDGLQPHEVAEEVAGAAALVGWKMVERSDVLRDALLEGGVAKKCYAVLQDAVSKKADEANLRVNALRRKEIRTAFESGLQELAFKEAPSAKFARRSRPPIEHAFVATDASLFCTRTSLGACQNAVGLLDALILRAPQHQQGISLASTRWLVGVATLEASLEARIAASAALCRALAESKTARKALALRPNTLPDLCATLQGPDQLCANLLSATLLANLVRDAQSRAVLDPAAVALAFAALVKLMEWTTNDLAQRPPTSFSGGGPHDLVAPVSVSPGSPTTVSSAADESADASAAAVSANTTTTTVKKSSQPGPDVRVSARPLPEYEARSAVCATLEYAALATWGCATALRERDETELDRLYRAPVAVWKLPPPAATEKKPKPRRRRSRTGSFARTSRMSRGSFDNGAANDDDDPDAVFKPPPRPLAWPEILVKVAGLAAEQGVYTAEDDSPKHAPKAVMCALATTVASERGPTALLEAVETPKGALLEDLMKLVETSPSMDVRVYAASALARASNMASSGLTSFYSGEAAVRSSTMKKALPADSRVVAVLAEFSGARRSHELDSALSAVLLNMAMYANPGEERREDVIRGHVALIERDESDPSMILRGVLRRGCMALWALARNPSNRARFNKLGAPAALAQALRGGARLVTKEIAVAALWLLAFDDDGAVRVALAEPRGRGSYGEKDSRRASLDDAEASSPSKGSSNNTGPGGRAGANGKNGEKKDDAKGKKRRPSLSLKKKEAKISSKGALATLVGVVNFDPDCLGYVPIRTLAIGALCKLARTNEDLLNVVAAYAEHFVAGLYELASGAFPVEVAEQTVFTEVEEHDAPPMVFATTVEEGPEQQRIRAEQCARTIQVLSVDLVFRLGENPEGAAALAAAKGPRALEELSTKLISKSTDKEMRAVGAFRAAKLACEPGRRRALDGVTVVPRLVDNLQDADAPPDVRLYSLHALLNLSTEYVLQTKICRSALDVLADVARSAPDSTAVVRGPGDPPTAPFLSSGGALQVPTTPEKRLDLESRYAQSVLANLSKNVQCRAIMYETQLAQCSTAIGKANTVALAEHQKPIAHLLKSDDDQGPLQRVQEVEDGETLSRFLTQPTPSIQGSMSLGSLPVSPRLNANQLHRLRRHLYEPVTNLWEEDPLDVTKIKKQQQQQRALPAATFPVESRKFSLESTASKQVTAMSTTIPDTSTKMAGEDLASFATTSETGASTATTTTGSSSTVTSVSATSSMASPGNKTLKTTASLRAERKPRAPFRSSHRLGPIAGAAPASLPQGECRWEPRIRSYARLPADPNAPPGTMVNPRSSPRLVQLEPLTQYNSVTFNAPLKPLGNNKKVGDAETPLPETASNNNDGNDGNDNNDNVLSGSGSKSTTWPQAPAKLVKFKHTPGSKLYTQLFPRFTLELDVDGRPELEECFFYYTSDIVCEAMDPGPVAMPEPPLTLDAIVQVVPPLPSLPVPSDLTPPEPFRPAAERSPDLLYHALMLSAQTGHIGGIPSDPMPIYARMVPKPEPDEIPEDAPPEWKVTESIFAARAGESDARGYYESPKVWRRALECDWKRLLQEDRFMKFVHREDEGVAKLGESLEEEVQEIKTCFSRRYCSILRIFDYYCASQTMTTKATWSINENAYNRFLYDCAVYDDATGCTVEECGRIFIQVNLESDKTSKEADINEDKALMRQEFLEALVRIAVARFKHETKDVSDCLDRLFDEVIFRNLPSECTTNADVFRRERLYCEEVEQVILSHQKTLTVLYTKYSMLNPIQGRAKFGIPEWLAIFTDARLLGTVVTTREARLSFWWSRMVIIDEVKSRHKFTTLSWLEFLEALGRLADMISLPTDEDYQAVRAINMVDYEYKVQQAPLEIQTQLLQRRPSADWSAVKTRPLADKYDKLCKLLLGRLGLKFKGAISGGGRRQSVVGTYLTKNQLQDISLD